MAGAPCPHVRCVHVGATDTSDALLLVATAETRAEYTGGDVLFMREGALVAQPFDAKALAFAGKPTQAAERIAYDEANGAGFSASPCSGSTLNTESSSSRILLRSPLCSTGRPVFVADGPAQSD